MERLLRESKRDPTSYMAGGAKAGEKRIFL